VLNAIRHLKQVVPHLNSLNYEKGIFDDLVRDLNLSKKEAELLGFRLQGWNLLLRDTEICFFRNRQNEFREFFSQEKDMVFCNYVFSVTEALGHQHDPPE